MALSVERRAEASTAFAANLRNSLNEAAWRAQFLDNPFVLTETVPLRVNCFYMQLEIDDTRPDLAMISRLGWSSRFACYSVVERRRPRDARLSVAIRGRHERAKVPPDELLEIELANTNFSIAAQYACWFSFAPYLLIVLSPSRTQLLRIVAETAQLQDRKLLPSGGMWHGYETLFHGHSHVSVPTLLLQAMPETARGSGVAEPRPLDMQWSEGIDDHRATRIVTSRGEIPLYSGRYRQVFGVPRLLWPLDESRWAEGYLSERRRILGERATEAMLIEARRRGMPHRLLEIEGDFDSERRVWCRKPLLKVYVRGRGVVAVETEEWPFTVCEGDHIYFDEGSALLVLHNAAVDPTG